MPEMGAALTIKTFPRLLIMPRFLTDLLDKPPKTRIVTKIIKHTIGETRIGLVEVSLISILASLVASSSPC